MDPVIIPSFIFAFVMAMLIGGFVLLFPVSRRLGEAVELWLKEHRKGGAAGELEALRSRIEAVAQQVAEIEKRQAFTEQLVEQRGAPSLPEAER